MAETVDVSAEMERKHDRVLGKLVAMGNNPMPWLLQRTRNV